MKAIQSFWSKPAQQGNRKNGGWLFPRYHYMSWALSCLQLKEHFESVELYTDELGKEILIDNLGLPYDKVHVRLQHVIDYGQDLWCLGKIYTYACQTEPFIHVDGDAYFYEPLPNSLLYSQLLVQTKHIKFNFYQSFVTSVEEQFAYIPSAIRHMRSKCDDIYFPNAGIIGGVNLQFMLEYANEALSFLEQNKDLLGRVNVNLLNGFLEEFLLLGMSEQKGIDIACYIESVDEDFFSLVDFDNVPMKRKYIHVVGMHKRYVANCKRLEQALRASHPLFYSERMKVFNNADV